MARHVPTRALPQGLVHIRQAAGWIPCDLTRPGSEALGVSAARPWLNAARQHAAVLGPPADLRHLLSVLADGLIRSQPTAQSVLAAAGAGEGSNPQILSDFAWWTLTPVPFTTLTIGRRAERPVLAYAAHAADLSAARTVSARHLRNGVVALERLTACLSGDGIGLDTAGSPRDLRDLLAISGDQEWVWTRSYAHNPLAKTMDRIATLNRPIPLEQIPGAVARSTTPRREPVAGEWPLPLDAVRAWLTASTSWTVAPDGCAYQSTAAQARWRTDHLVNEILSPHRAPVPWKQLYSALHQAGFPPASAKAAILRSPLLRRAPTGYLLLG